MSDSKVRLLFKISANLKKIQPTPTPATVNSEYFEALMNNISQMAKTFQHGSKSSTPGFSVDSFAGLPTENANQWLDKFDAWIAFHGWNKENEKIASVMRLKLEGGALSWFNGLPNSVKRNSDQLFTKFKEHFSGLHPTWMLEQHLYERCMLPSESLVSTNYDTLALIYTGADISVANPSLISKLRNIGVRVKIVRSDKESILTANNEKAKIIGVISVNIVVGKENAHVIFYLVPGLKPNIILGISTESSVLASHSLLAAKSLSEVRNGTVAHGLCNLTDKPITIKKNSNVGKFVCLSDKDKVFVVNESKTSVSAQNTPIKDEGAVMNEVLSHIGHVLRDKERNQLVNLLESYSNVFANGGKLRYFTT
ncbi:unnamed protein product [Mytilus coruscus]|uniref:Retrotransposon gag domain-containing protein n=1 Tax=Mytilus coruscus TaxID=42192 RepID=A0A6J8AS18_MYTCO|nr:unnamed protein product [Mytilus coruscus]